MCVGRLVSACSQDGLAAQSSVKQNTNMEIFGEIIGKTKGKLEVNKVRFITSRLMLKRK